MKAILICPGHRPAVPHLLEAGPLAATPLLGETLLNYWLVHLASLGAKEVTILACDRPGAIRQLAGTGARWGLRVKVVGEMHELTPDEARAKHGGDGDWLPAPYDAVQADYLPGLKSHPLFESYASWFAAIQAWQ